jgi:DNA processing protein
MLFVRGNAEALARPAVGIVGARDARRDAEAWAFERAAEAAVAGHVVASGGARGIDAAAHQGALRAGGTTVAYLGVPADRIYPRGNERLFRAMLEGGGALVSEHPPGVSTPAFEHAKRNRFIAAHASRLYIAEARASSGTLATARYARRHGVPVLVSPPGVGAQRDGIDMLLAKGWASSARH